MGLFDKVSGFVKREAEDIGEAAERVRDRLDEELTEREEELEMTPAEKLRALQRKARQTDERVDKIMEKAGASAATTDAAAEVADATAPPVIREPPSVTQIVLADGSIRSGDDPTPTSGSEDGEDEDPDEGDLSWVAPRQGEEAVVPAFSSAVSAASPSDATPETPDEMPDEMPDDGDDADDTLALEPAESEPAAPEAPAPEAAQSGPPQEAAPEALSTFTNDTSPALHPVSADPAVSAHPESPGDDGVATAAASTGTDLPPPPPPPMPEPAPVVQAPLEPVAPNEAPPRRETPAEIAARVVAELEQAVAEDPEPAPAAAAPPAPPEPSFDKTPAQRKYEEARKAADALLEELRGELRDDGEI